MNILFLNYEFPPIGGGASPVSYEIAKGYVANGHHVDVVTMKYKDLPSFEIQKGIHIYRIRCLRTKKEICHPWEQLTYLLSAIYFLSKRLKKVKYDVNHTHFIIPTGAIAIFLKMRYKIPYILTSHGSDVLGYNNRFSLLYPILKKPWKAIIRNASIITAPSDYLLSLIQKHVYHQNMVTIPNGINPEQFPKQKKEKRILIVARLFVNKGIQDIIEALAEIDLGDWKVDIVGDGPYRDTLESLANERRISSKINFHGWLDHASQELKNLYGIASIFISASYFESFGLTVLEAISADCYPILSDIPGHRFIIDDDNYFFPKGNHAELKKKIQLLLQLKDFQHFISIDRFYWSSVIHDYIKYIEEAR